MLLDAAADDIPDPDSARRLMRDLREVRMAKLRAGVGVLEGGREVKMNGVGGMEIAEGRAFIAGVIDGLRCVQILPTLSSLKFLRITGLHVNDMPSGKSEHQRSCRERKERPKSGTMISEVRATMMTQRWICKKNGYIYKHGINPIYDTTIHPVTALSFKKTPQFLHAKKTPPFQTPSPRNECVIKDTNGLVDDIESEVWGGGAKTGFFSLSLSISLISHIYTKGRSV